MEKLYTLSDLVSFGKFMRSDLREESLVHKKNRKEVSDADIARWQEIRESEEK